MKPARTDISPRATVFARLASAISIALLALPPMSTAQIAAADPARDFETRVGNYLQLRQTATAARPKGTASPGKLNADQEDLAANLRAARPHAKQGDIFTPEIATYFRRQIASALSGPKGPSIKATLRHAEPVKLRVQVNQRYPQGAPLQSTPPSLLLNLPPLPKELEYRIVDSTLVLRDEGANVIVDFVPNVFPKL
jgi:hypothetical protein